MKGSQVTDKNLWLVHLVQAKKLFLKLSAYVELYLKQDWSLLPVPDFKLVARSESWTSHLNFMVAAVLLTATHSGTNPEFIRILDLVIPSAVRNDIRAIQDAFLLALEPKSPKKSFTNSPRRTSLNPTAVNSLDITPKALFPTNLSIVENAKEVEETEEIRVQQIEIKAVKVQENVETEVEDLISIIDNFHDNKISSSSSELIESQNCIKILEIKLEELEKVVQASRERESIHLETENQLKMLKLRLIEMSEELKSTKERHEYEKIERNSLMASFDQERVILDEHIEMLRRENAEKNSKIHELTSEMELLHKADDTSDISHTNYDNYNSDCNNDELKEELNQANVNNSKLVKALNKARDHIIKQDSLISELKEALKSTESRYFADLKAKDESIQKLKESYSLERTEMNRIVGEIGVKIQRINL